jgi:hypothetical protein
MRVISEQGWKEWTQPHGCDHCGALLEIAASDLQRRRSGRLCVRCPVCKLRSDVFGIPRYVAARVPDLFKEER